MDQVKSKDQTIYLGSLPKMGYKMYGEKFFKTSRDTQKDEQATPIQRTTTPSQNSNEMILNILMRIDEKLTDQYARIEKIEENLQDLGNLMKDKKKSPSSPTPEHTPAAPSLTSTGQASENSDFQAEDNAPESGLVRKSPTPKPENEEKSNEGIEIVGSFNDNSPLHDEPQVEKPPPTNFEEILIRNVFHQMVKDE
ncbi:uncharacterized protein LOC110428491 [Herrania umbratica]|uniref:Uncharacterized protein LOC110428491 n=1 Tax=Herrania umbratica TaxID=108875 RepID=A0A6J1BLM9_9ROSI|nr:uncharacterized protein LOC110428491 [Herrania umbratica]